MYTEVNFPYAPNNYTDLDIPEINYHFRKEENSRKFSLSSEIKSTPNTAFIKGVSVVNCS